MSEVLYYAIPFFVLLLVVEGLTYRHLQSDGLVGYELQKNSSTQTHQSPGSSRSGVSS
jgi:hypothetical protein